MSKIYNSITELIGNTPIVKLNNIVPEDAADVYVKIEAFNPGSSVKDRIALRMIEDAEKAGTIKPGDIIVEPTSGNTGIGLAWVGAAKGYKVIIVMPETMSVERRKIIQAYGAELVLTPGSEGMKGAIEKAKEIAEEKMVGCLFNLLTLLTLLCTKIQQVLKLSKRLVRRVLMPLFLVLVLVEQFQVFLMLLKKLILTFKFMLLKLMNLPCFLVKNLVHIKSKVFQLVSS